MAVKKAAEDEAAAVTKAAEDKAAAATRAAEYEAVEKAAEDEAAAAKKAAEDEAADIFSTCFLPRVSERSPSTDAPITCASPYILPINPIAEGVAPGQRHERARKHEKAPECEKVGERVTENEDS